MKKHHRLTVLIIFFLSCWFSIAPASASEAEHVNHYTQTITMFRNAGVDNSYFKNSYGYVVFPNIGKGGLIVGAAHGTGRLYVHGNYTGNVKMTQISLGLLGGGENYSQIMFLKDQRALNDLASGNLEFSSQASTTLITAGASATGGTMGSNSSTSAGQNDASVNSDFHKGVAVFVITKGGFMLEASLSGQKYSYEPHSLEAAKIIEAANAKAAKIMIKAKTKAAEIEAAQLAS